MNICKSERLNIRQFNVNDAAFMLTLLNEESFIRNINDKGVRTLQDAKKHLIENPIASYQQHGFGLYLVELANTNTPIGICGLLKRETFDFPELGYAFLPAYWGKGYALEAANSALHSEINTHSIAKVIAVTAPENESSKGLLTKLGFSQCGMVELYNTNNNLFEYINTNDNNS